MNKEGVIVWHEAFSQRKALMPGGPMPHGQFNTQLENLLAGKPLIDNGPEPKEEDDDDGEVMAGDLDLGF